jgi:hypothetical protein
LTLEQAVILITEQEHAERVWAVLRAFGDDSIDDLQPLEVKIVE